MLVDGATRIAAGIGAPKARTVTYGVGIPQQTLISRAVEAVRTGAARTVVVAGAETKRRETWPVGPGSCRPSRSPRACPTNTSFPRRDRRSPGDRCRCGPPGPSVRIDRQCSPGRRRLDDRRTSRRCRPSLGSIQRGGRRQPQGGVPDPANGREIRDPSTENRALAFPYSRGTTACGRSIRLPRCDQLDRAADERGVDGAAGVPAGRARIVVLPLALAPGRTAPMALDGGARRCGGGHLGRRLDTVEHVELYSCFPAAVRVQQQELGLDPDAVDHHRRDVVRGWPVQQFRLQAGGNGRATPCRSRDIRPRHLRQWPADQARPLGMGYDTTLRGVLVADLALDAEAAIEEAPRGDPLDRAESPPTRSPTTGSRPSSTSIRGSAVAALDDVRR